jgi:hypothetical protein
VTVDKGREPSKTSRRYPKKQKPLAKLRLGEHGAHHPLEEGKSENRVLRSLCPHLPLTLR